MTMQLSFKQLYDTLRQIRQKQIVWKFWIGEPKIGDALVFWILICYQFLRFSRSCHGSCKSFCMDEKLPKLLKRRISAILTVRRHFC